MSRHTLQRVLTVKGCVFPAGQGSSDGIVGLTLGSLSFDDGQTVLRHLEGGYILCGKESASFVAGVICIRIIFSVDFCVTLLKI